MGMEFRERNCEIKKIPVDNTESLGYNHSILDLVPAIEDGRNTILENATLSACSYDYKDARYMVIGKVVEQ